MSGFIETADGLRDLLGGSAELDLCIFDDDFRDAFLQALP